MSQETNGKNGNGKNGNVKEELNLTQVDDLIDASVLTLFFVQKLGKASASDVQERMLENDGTINEHLLDQALEALRGRGLLSYARGAKKSGERVQMYKTTKVKWAQPPEVALIKDLLPALVATPEATRIMNILNGKEEIGDGEKKSKRQLGYADFYDITAVFKTTNPLLGSQPDSPWLRKIVKASPIKAPNECDLRFWRDDLSGAVVIPQDVICGYLREFARNMYDKAASAVVYISAADVLLNPKELFQVELPIIDEQTKKGLGLGTYELIPSGTIVEMNFRVPARGIAPPNDFLLKLAAYAMQPSRGFSPARGRRFGKAEMIDSKVHGASKKVTSGNFVTNRLVHDEAKTHYATLISKVLNDKAGDETPPAN